MGFVGAGNVAHSLGAFDLDDPKVAGGGGLRFALSPEQRVNLRVDFAVTREGDSNLYVGLLEVSEAVPEALPSRPVPIHRRSRSQLSV